MTEQTVVRAWGNSQGIRLSKKILETAKIGLDDLLQVEVSENTIILKKAFRHKSFEERLADYDGKIDVLDFDWGEPLGKELV